MVEIILEQRKAAHFSSMEDFVARCQPGLEQLLLLISTGAMRFTGEDKKGLLWKAHLLLAGNKAHKGKHSGVALLFQPAFRMPEVPQFEWANDEDFFDEMELLGFSVSLSPFFMLQEQPDESIRCNDLMGNVGKRIAITGLFVTMKQTRTRKGEAMAFGTFLDQDGQFFDTVHFPKAYLQYPFRQSGIYKIYGLVAESFGFPSIIVDEMVKLPIRQDPRYAAQQNFLKLG